MPNYIAASPNVLPAPRPAFDVGGVINSLSAAFANNREGVLHRALLQHQVARENAELVMQQQEHELQMRSQGWRPTDEVQASAPASQGGASLSAATPTVAGPSEAAQPSAPPPPGAIPDAAMPAAPVPSVIPESAIPAAAPSTAPIAPPSAAGPPAAQATMNGRKWVLGTPPVMQRQMDARRSALSAANQAHPGMFTPEQIETAVHDDKTYQQMVARVDKADEASTQKQNILTALTGATDLHGKPLSDSMKQMLSLNPTAYAKYTDLMLNPPKDPVEVHKAERLFDNANQPTKQVTMTGPDGKRYIGVYDANTGEVHSTGVEAIQPGSGKGGAGDAKAAKYVDLMTGSLPTMQELTSKVRPAAITAELLSPNAGNIALTKDEQRYMVAFRTFLAGELHAESGARLSHEQLQFGLQRYGPTVGDFPETLQYKLQSAQQAAHDAAKEIGRGATPAASGAGTGKSIWDFDH